MLNIKLITLSNDGRIKLTKEELEDIMNQAYHQGYEDCMFESKEHKYAWTNKPVEPIVMNEMKEKVSEDGEDNRTE